MSKLLHAQSDLLEYAIKLCYHEIVNSRHKKTLEAVMSRPTRGSILFAGIEVLVKALGGDVREGAGYRVVFELGWQRKYMPLVISCCGLLLNCTLQPQL